MRHLTLAATALVFASTFALAPAKAEFNGPIQQNGQCRKAVDNSHEIFYIWGACPKPAAAPVVHHARRQHRG